MGVDANGDGKGIEEVNKIEELVTIVLALKEQGDKLRPDTKIKTEDMMPPRVKIEDGLKNDKECIDLVSDDDDAHRPQEHVDNTLPPLLQDPPKRIEKSMYTKPLPTLLPSEMETTSAEPSPQRPRVKSSVQNHKKNRISKYDLVPFGTGVMDTHATVRGIKLGKKFWRQLLIAPKSYRP